MEKDKKNKESILGLTKTEESNLKQFLYDATQSTIKDIYKETVSEKTIKKISKASSNFIFSFLTIAAILSKSK